MRKLQKYIAQLEPDIRTIGSYRAICIANKRSIAFIKEINFDAIIIEDEAVLYEVMLDDRLYLLPVFCDGKMSFGADGNLLDFTEQQLARKIDKIREAIKDYFELSFPKGEDVLCVKLLRYLVTRKISLEPQNDHREQIGYRYPLVNVLSVERDILVLHNYLSQLVQKGYFKSRTIDKVNICTDCDYGFLNFTECCSKCNSIDIESEELVHHFRCAYVGPQSDFTKEDRLVCPKCAKHLKHIGIDYDKPSEIHRCKHCAHESQETKMKAKCVHCGKDNELEQLTTLRIEEYSVTEKAMSVASQVELTEGIGTESEDQSEIFTNKLSYNLIRSHESRKARSKNSVHELSVEINASILEKLNVRLKNLLVVEIAHIISPYLRKVDLISRSEQNTILVLLVDYSSTEAAELLEVLHYNLSKMLFDNGYSTEDPIHFGLSPVIQ